MKQTLLLFLSADRLHAQHMAGDNIAMQRDFTDSAEGREGFKSFMQSIKCPVYLLVDLIEEDFRHEVVPHLSGGNRTALLQRKFEQFYRGTPFLQATLLHRQKTGRRDDNILFSALTNPSLIMPWLNILLAQKSALAGIYSVPQISAPLIKDQRASHLLLVSWEKYSGLRQTYFSGHHLQVSRLTPVHADVPFHDAVVRELARTFQYLKSLSLLPSGQILDVLILCHSDGRGELQGKLPNNADMRYGFLDIAGTGKKFGINYRFTDSDASQIFLHQLASHPPKSNYANATHTHFFNLGRIKFSLNLASAILLLGATLWSASNFLNGSSNATEATELKAQTQQTLNEVQKVTLTFPNTHAPATDMKAGVSVMRKLKMYTLTPLDIMGPISAALQHHPQIQLDDLAWLMSATEPVASNTLADVPAQVVTLKGRMIDFANDYRAVLNYLESFQRDLIAQGYQVTVLTKPFDASPGGSIADQRETRVDAMVFSVKISRRPEVTAPPDNNRPPA